MAATTSGINVAGLLLTVSLLTACAGEPAKYEAPGSAPRTAAKAPPSSVRHRAALAAIKQVGTPYRYGGANERGFDCSGLVYYAYSKAGRSLPRTTGGLWQTLEPVTVRNLKVGDVLFFDIEGKVAHVGLYLGGRRFVHAPASGREVAIASLESDFYKAALIRGGRPR